MNHTFFTGNSHSPEVGSVAPSNVMVEVACEYVGGKITCNFDQFGFKGLAAQWMWPTVQAAPFLAAQISTGLESSAKAAANQCSTDTNGTICGFRWADDEVGRSFGFGTQLSAPNLIMANLVSSSKPPVTAKTATQQGSSDTQDDSAQSSSHGTMGSRLGLLLVIMTLTAPLFVW